jgi:hypothetical protein
VEEMNGRVKAAEYGLRDRSRRGAADAPQPSQQVNNARNKYYTGGAHMPTHYVFGPNDEIEVSSLNSQ